MELANQVWRIQTFPHPKPEEKVGLTPVPAQKVTPPLFEECKAQLENTLVQHLEYGEEAIFIGEYVAGSVDKTALECSDLDLYMKRLLFLEDGIFGVIEASQRVGIRP